MHTYQVNSKEKNKNKKHSEGAKQQPVKLGSVAPFDSRSVFPGSPGEPTARFDIVHELSVAQIVQTLCVHTCSSFYGFNCIAFVIAKGSSPGKT